MPLELKIPTVGESITEVQIGKWLKAKGDPVEKDEALVEIETDKVNVELPAPEAGTITEIVKQAGEMAVVGEVIGYLEPGAVAQAVGAKGDGGGRKAAPPATTTAATATAATTTATPRPATATPAAPSPVTADRRRPTPAARRALAEHGLEPDEVTASGPAGRLLKEDVLRHLERQETSAAGTRAPSISAPSPIGAAPLAPVTPGSREEEAVAMSPMRRRIAERLVAAQQAAALLSSFNEIDMGEVIALRQKLRESFQERYGVKLGFMSFFVKAVIEALKLIPQLNAEIRGTEIVYRNYYDIGIAVSTERGLVVPVLRNAERMSFAQIETAIADFAERARLGRIKLEELAGGTFTISNGGVYGSLLSTPIINPPQSGILGMHAILERPVARERQVVIRPMMYVALTYDHRIVDGREAVTFLKRVKEVIEDPARILLEI